MKSTLLEWLGGSIDSYIRGSRISFEWFWVNKLHIYTVKVEDNGKAEKGSSEL